ncbi:phage head-tail connector protein [Paraliobacillus ryukyuensis]|uniref:phage head-tail connector protein n=1 Tax=Paraliobacillus ryukyuensis TaxID=200904 RepID=UPI0009A7EA01|nr:phage head-tail connector protein [Paraliobacillus ryukyuensis]
MAELEDVKTLLNITDSTQDNLINLMINNVRSHLKIKLGKDVPTDLTFIVTEIVVRRFNRVGSEGMQSESVEGHSITFYDLEKEFTPYEDIIEKYKVDDGTSNRAGKVRFF